MASCQGPCGEAGTGASAAPCRACSCRTGRTPGEGSWDGAWGRALVRVGSPAADGADVPRDVGWIAELAAALLGFDWRWRSSPEPGRDWRRGRGARACGPLVGSETCGSLIGLGNCGV